jgi:threonine/homoserine/homoserine lactone efflux protein
MQDTLTFLFSGIALGLIAGISPGPILTLVISETLKHNKKEGIKISLSPLITDLPIILLTVFLIAKLSVFHQVLGFISAGGAVFLLVLAYECIVFKDIVVSSEPIKAQSLKKGITANFLNPNPYLFWLTVGAPLLIKAYHEGLCSVAAFIFGFYFCLTGSKIAVVMIVDHTKSLLNKKVYSYIIRILGLILIVFAIVFIKEAFKFFGFLS